MKLRECTVFTRLSVHRRGLWCYFLSGSMFLQWGGGMVPEVGVWFQRGGVQYTLYPTSNGSHWSRQYASYWNALLLLPANLFFGKVMFSHLCVILFRGGFGWFPSMHHRSHDQGICIRGVCLHGRVYLQGGCWADPHPQTHGILRDTVNKRTERILLECILVLETDSGSVWIFVSNSATITV